MSQYEPKPFWKQDPVPPRPRKWVAKGPNSVATVLQLGSWWKFHVGMHPAGREAIISGEARERDHAFAMAEAAVLAIWDQREFDAMADVTR